MTSFAPGQVPVAQALVSPEALTAASDAELSHTAAAILNEQHRRALDGLDVDAMVEQAFLHGFAGDGRPHVPWLTGGLLVCPGYIRYRSTTSHDCVFITADDQWVWQHESVIHDLMRQVPGPKVVKQSITILTPREGMEVDVVTSTSRGGGPCQMKQVTSWQVRGGEIAQVTSRRKAPEGHTRG